jgi:predicted  nucleic acid-binding Zn-ribbon protein
MGREMSHMGDHDVVDLVLRHTARAIRPRRGAEGDRLEHLGQLDVRIRDLEEKDREHIRQIEEQRSQITLLTIRLREQKTRPLTPGLDADTVREATREREREIACLESSLKTRLREFEESLKETHDLRLELGRRRDAASREHAAVLEALEGPTRAAYEYLVRLGRTPVIVPVREGICSGCDAEVPFGTDLAGEERKGVTRCPQCERFLTEPL